MVAHLDLRDAIHIGHSTGGGEATRYVARHAKGRVAKAGAHRRGAAGHGQDPANPGGLPIGEFDERRRMEREKGFEPSTLTLAT